MAKAVAAALVVMCLFLVSLSHGHGDGATTQEISSCSTVLNDLFPCLSYVLNGGKHVDPACCSGLKAVLGLASTRTDRQTVCSCLKSVSSTATDDQIKNAAKIPKKCGVKLPFHIARDVDCSQIN